MKRLLLLPLLLMLTQLAAQQGWVNSAFSEDKSRRFDFWVGQWDVNLRIQQADKSWKDSVQAEARIYSILDGRAVLELWNSEPIVGYSLRYYDAARDKWVLWLNWPGRNQAGSSSLEGQFRHGRGEFFQTEKTPDGTTRLARYSFSDVSPSSLRWDDAYTTDGGKTWSSNWLMEFTRTGDEPRLGKEKTAHTWAGGGRCDRPDFRAYEGLAGGWRGEDGLSGRGYQVLGGCAVLLFREAGDLKTFGHLTYHTGRREYELTLIDNQGGPARLFYGSRRENRLLLEHRPSPEAEPNQGFALTLPGEGDATAVEELFERSEGSWVSRYRFELRRN